jgi:hypothetical protein
MKFLMIIIILALANPANADDNCFQNLKRSVREDIVCLISKDANLIAYHPDGSMAKGSEVPKIETDACKKLLDDLDGGLINQAKARDIFNDIKKKSTKLYQKQLDVYTRADNKSASRTAPQNIDKCNPYVKKGVREHIVCQIDKEKQLQIQTSNSSMSSNSKMELNKTSQRFIDERKELLDALDAKAISPSDAGSALVAIGESDDKYLENIIKINSQIDSNYYLPSTRQEPIDFTCTKQSEDSVRCR